MKVCVVRTGSANLASMVAALVRAGAEPHLTEDADEIARSERLVLPGVGALGATKARLDALGLSPLLAERVRSGRPTLAVCLGLQLLFEGSEESPGVAGFGVMPGIATRFPRSVRVPQLGWNRIEAPEGARFFETAEVYFANSFRVEAAPPGVLAATAEHGGRFVAGFEKGSLLACQFHPELSSAAGAAMIGRWLQRC